MSIRSVLSFVPFMAKILAIFVLVIATVNRQAEYLASYVSGDGVAITMVTSSYHHGNKQLSPQY